MENFKTRRHSGPRHCTHRTLFSRFVALFRGLIGEGSYTDGTNDSSLSMTHYIWARWPRVIKRHSIRPRLLVRFEAFEPTMGERRATATATMSREFTNLQLSSPPHVLSVHSVQPSGRSCSNNNSKGSKDTQVQQQVVNQRAREPTGWLLVVVPRRETEGGREGRATATVNSVSLPPT